MEVTKSLELSCGLNLKNRLFFAPISTLSCQVGGEISEQDYNFYEKRANGVGAVVLGSAYISQIGKAYEGGIGISHQRHVTGLTKLAALIKKQGAKAIIQLYHGGAMASYVKTNRQPFCVSLDSSELKESHRYAELTSKHIETIYEEYEMALIRAIKSGFDGIEIHAASNYLPYQFLSESWNHRTDEYGGDLKNRMRFTTGLIERLKNVIDKHAVDSFALGIRISESDSSVEGEKRWESFQQTLLILQELNTLPLDYIHLASADFMQEIEIEGRVFSKASLLKTMSPDVPLIGCGGLLQVEDIESSLENVSLVSACRPFIFEPNWAECIMENKKIYFEEKTLTGAVRQELAIPRSLWDGVKESKDWYMYR